MSKYYSKTSSIGFNEEDNIDKPELLQGGFFWDYAQYKQIMDYLKAMQQTFEEPRTPNKVMKVYACLLGMEFLVQAKLQRKVENVISNYKTVRVSEDEAETMERNGKFVEAINRLHKWALALEPYFRNLRSAESASIVAGKGMEG